jgi:hypothetical protein
MANMQIGKRPRERSVAASVQRAAQELADAEARRIPWQLLEEARRHYVDWQEFCFWARSVMDSIDAVPAWLAEQIDNRCPGFLEEDRRCSAEHPGEGFLTPVRLGSWIDDHVFGFARKGGWLNAISYYAVRAPRYQRASVCWSQSVDRWRKAQPIRYPSFEEWLQDAAKCDDAANLLPEIREQRQCFKLVAPDRLDQAVASYIDWEAFAYWCRPALERGAPLPETVASELQRRCPGFLDFKEEVREGADLLEHDWHRLTAWMADHFFGDAKRERWLNAILISVRNHPRAIRTMEYWEYCDAKWSPSLPVPYPAFEYWRRNADQFVDLGVD